MLTTDKPPNILVTEMKETITYKSGSPI